MSSMREVWLFKVQEMGDGHLCLSPQQDKDPQQPARGPRPPASLLDDWHIRFLLPEGTDPGDADRIASLLNDWVREVSCARIDDAGPAENA